MKVDQFLILLYVVFGLSCNNLESIGIEGQIEKLISGNKEIESVSVGLIYPDGEIELHKGVLLDGSKPNSESLYEIASLTKTFTGALLVIALDERKINLDDDIRNYLPDNLDNLEYLGEPITFRHLVSHRSGLPLFFPFQEDLFQHEINWDKLPFEWNDLQDGFSRNDFFNCLSNYVLTRKPGSSVEYSNVGANLVGYLLEAIYQKSYSELLNEYFFQPLKMYDTKINLSEDDLIHLVKGVNSNNLVMPTRVVKDMNAEGGLKSSVRDIIKYMKYHLSFESDSSTVMHEAVVGGDDFHRGVFWQLEGKDLIYQHGGAFGTSSILDLDLNSGIGVFLVTNSAGPEVHFKLSDCIDQIRKIIEAK